VESGSSENQFGRRAYQNIRKDPARSQRQFCTVCGGHLMLALPSLGLVNIFASTVPTLEFKPVIHVNYADTVLPMRDGLPKLKDFPAEVGGSGEMLAEW
jgi:hypothetical protein